MKFKAQTQLNKKCSSVKYSKIKGIPKLDDANDAGVLAARWLIKELHSDAQQVDQLTASTPVS